MSISMSSGSASGSFSCTFGSWRFGSSRATPSSCSWPRSSSSSSPSAPASSSGCVPCGSRGGGCSFGSWVCWSSAAAGGQERGEKESRKKKTATNQKYGKGKGKGKGQVYDCISNLPSSWDVLHLDWSCSLSRDTPNPSWAKGGCDRRTECSLRPICIYSPSHL
ncbi:hypothetical protein VTK73DRAFT_6239 [Phialemonium thermophilum]|uniref:Uncharacterized protein n=1 Tax=Phialemonium thermophilum TaxID=223376 RepID=A0ABR3V0Y4_9PEZI